MTGLVLASTSVTRAGILRAAGVGFRVEAPDVDEAAVKLELLSHGIDPGGVAEQLAARKAAEVSMRVAGMVIGADQTLDVDGALFDKVPTLAEARVRLMALRGREHRLHSAVAVASAGVTLWRGTSQATLRMRVFSDAFLDGYLARQGEQVLSSVGCYQLEGEGIQLFAEVRGDFLAILGLPLLPLLSFLRARDAVAS
ncbi:MAG TPA: Maf family protein [Caulobacteraceae bacterium]|nr:Maf family protein [Caulobacteraceae bacterium]